MVRFERIAVWALSCALVGGAGSLSAQDQPAPTQAQAATQTPDQLRQLVAPIALYPDALVAQILAAATYPVQVVEAERWVQQRTDLPADQVAAGADSESWDPSVKALTGFPSVLAMMDTNLGWTSALGEAYTNQPQDVLDAVQALRKQAQDNGRLTSTPQQTVTSEGQIISVAPANPDIVYVPVYDPCTIYGWPIVVYPRWQCVVGPPAIWFGVGVQIGWWPRAWGWGWRSWGFDWHRRVVTYNRAPWVSRTNTFYGRVGGPGWSRPVPGRPVPGARGVRPSIEPNRRAGPLDRGFGQDRAHTGTHSGALSGFGQGGNARGASARGRASAGSGGARGGGGGGHRK